MDGRCSLFILTSTVLMISVPSNGSQKTDGGEDRHHSLKSVNLAALRPKRPVSSRVQKKHKYTQALEYLYINVIFLIFILKLCVLLCLAVIFLRKLLFQVIFLVCNNTNKLCEI